MNKITITVSGAPNTGKSTIAAMISVLLRQASLPVDFRGPDHENAEALEEWLFSKDAQLEAMLAQLAEKVEVVLVESQTSRDGLDFGRTSGSLLESLLVEARLGPNKHLARAIEDELERRRRKG